LLRFLLSVLLVIVFLIAAADPLRCQDVSFTLDFETGDLRGWRKTGNAFDFQPTLDDNPTARNRGQPSGHQGRYWIGTYERYQGRRGQKPGDIQGDAPSGTLTSAPFTIPKGTLSFLIGGGASAETRVELLVAGEHAEPRHSRYSSVRQPERVLSASGQDSETMHRVTWNLGPFAGKTGAIRIVDGSSGGWGHINVDDFRFSSAQTGTSDGPAYRVDLSAAPQSAEEGEDVHFRASLSRRTERAEYCFSFGEGMPCTWSRNWQADHTYSRLGAYQASVAVRLGERVIAESSPVMVRVRAAQVARSLMLRTDKTRAGVDDPVKFRAVINPPLDNVEYTFSFGDSEVRAHSNISEVEHRYRSEGTFHAFVTASARGRRIAASEHVSIAVEKAPEKPVARIEPERRVVAQGEIAVFESRSTPGGRIRESWEGPGGRGAGGKRFDVHTEGLAPGEYEIVLEVRDRQGRSARSAATLEITVPSAGQTETQQSSLSLSWRPLEPKEGEKVIFTVVSGLSDDRLKYLVLFGDGQASGWSAAGEIEHIYGKAGVYSASVSARIGDRIVAESRPMAVTVTKQQPGIPWDKIIAGLLLAGGFYAASKILRRSRGKRSIHPPLTIRPVVDPGGQEIEGGYDPPSFPGVRLRPEADPGIQEIESHGEITEDERREHG
jgi:hypothetical protein